jgi:hypothetical protein
MTPEDTPLATQLPALARKHHQKLVKLQWTTLVHSVFIVQKNFGRALETEPPAR